MNFSVSSDLFEATPKLHCSLTLWAAEVEVDAGLGSPGWGFSAIVSLDVINVYNEIRGENLAPMHL